MAARAGKIAPRPLHPALSAVLLAVIAVLCFAFALICWNQGHVTYGLPDGSTGHDVVERPIAGAVVCAALGVIAVAAGVLGTLRRSTWLGAVPLLAPCVAGAVAI